MSKTVEQVDLENLEFTPVKEQIMKFHNFKTSPIMVGRYVGPYKYENPEKKILITGFEFVDKDGFHFLVNEAYQIEKAIEEYGETWYKIEFTGQTPLDGGKKVNNYKISAVQNIK